MLDLELKWEKQQFSSFKLPGFFGKCYKLILEDLKKMHHMQSSLVLVSSVLSVSILFNLVLSCVILLSLNIAFETISSILFSTVFHDFSSQV